MTMHKAKTFLAVLAAVALLAGSASAQTALTATTLAAALTNANDQAMTLASATGFTASTSSAQTFALIDREVVGLRSLSGVVAQISRGQFSTVGTGHLSGAKVYYIPAGSVTLGFRELAGACSTAGNADLSQSGASVPVFNPRTGHAWYCLGSQWVPVTDLMGTKTCTVTQASSKATGVTCAGMAGTITMNNASLTTITGFTVTDTHVAAGDSIVLSIKSGATANSYVLFVDAVAAGSFHVVVDNITGGALTDTLVVNFAVRKPS